MRQDYIDEQQAKADARVSLDRPVTDLNLGTREKVLAEAGLATVGDILERLEGGSQALLEISGFGRKSLIDLKKALRNFGYQIPEAAEEITI